MGMANKFAALWPTDPKFSVLKDLNLFIIVSKVQETRNILRVGFALSKWPHLHRAYLVAAPEYLSHGAQTWSKAFCILINILKSFLKVWMNQILCIIRYASVVRNMYSESPPLLSLSSPASTNQQSSYLQLTNISWYKVLSCLYKSNVFSLKIVHKKTKLECWLW